MLRRLRRYGLPALPLVACLSLGSACSSSDSTSPFAPDGGSTGARDGGGATGSGGSHAGDGGSSSASGGSGGATSSGGVGGAGTGAGGSANGGAGVGGTASGGADAGLVVDGSVSDDASGSGGSGAGGALGTGGTGGTGTGGTGTGGTGTGGTGTGGTGTGGATAAPLTLYDTTPQGSATDVAPDTLIDATFTAALNASSVSTTSFSVKIGAATVAGTATAAGMVASFTPSRLLDLDTTYTMTLGTGLASSAGGHLAAPFTWSFKTRRWGVPVAIDLPSDPLGANPRVAVDAKGNAIVAWFQFDATGNTLWANRYVSASGKWGVAQRLDTVDGVPASAPRLAMDKDGNAVVVWAQPSAVSAPASIWAARYTSAGWATPVLLETDDTGEALTPLVHFDPAGNAIALWNQRDNAGIYNLWSNRFVAGGAWGTRVRVETNHVGNGCSFDVGVDGAGNASAVWNMNKGAGMLVYSSRYVPGSAWTAAATIESGTEYGDQPHVALDAAGNGVAAWVQSNGTNYNLWGARYAVASGWQTAAKLQSNLLADASSIVIAADAAGNALVLWTQSDATGSEVWTDAYVLASSAWSGSASVDVGNGPGVAVSSNGHAAASWYSGGVRVNAGPVDTSVATAWGASFSPNPQATLGGGADVSVNDTGTAFAAWTETVAGKSRIWANRFR